MVLWLLDRSRAWYGSYRDRLLYFTDKKHGRPLGYQPQRRRAYDKNGSWLRAL